MFRIFVVLAQTQVSCLSTGFNSIQTFPFDHELLMLSFVTLLLDQACRARHIATSYLYDSNLVLLEDSELFEVYLVQNQGSQLLRDLRFVALLQFSLLIV